MALITKAKIINALHERWRNDANEELIDDLIDSVTSVAENYTGRKLLYGEYEERYWGGDKLIALSSAPVWSITHVKLSGEVFTGYSLHANLGLLKHPRTWPEVEIDVKYFAGWGLDAGEVTPPADLSGAVRDEVVARFYVMRSQPRVGEGLVDLTSDFLTDKAEKVFKSYKLERL